MLASHDRVTAVNGAQLGTVWAGVVALDMVAAWTAVNGCLTWSGSSQALAPLYQSGAVHPCR
jgi:hypothetical protein